MFIELRRFREGARSVGPGLGARLHLGPPGDVAPTTRPFGRFSPFSSTNRGVAIETREMTYLFNSRTADSFLAFALCGGAIGKPNFGFPRARIRDIGPSV